MYNSADMLKNSHVAGTVKKKTSPRSPTPTISETMLRTHLDKAVVDNDRYVENGSIGVDADEGTQVHIREEGMEQQGQHSHHLMRSQ